MREIRTSGSERGAGRKPCFYLYPADAGVPGLCPCGEPALQPLGGGAAHPDRF